MATEVGATPVAEMDARDDGGSNEPNGDAVDAMAVDIAKETVAMEAADDEGETEEKEKEADGAKEDREEKGDVNEGDGEGEDEEGSDGDAAQQAAARRQVRGRPRHWNWAPTKLLPRALSCALPFGTDRLTARARCCAVPV